LQDESAMPEAALDVERAGRAAVVHLRGDVGLARARALDTLLGSLLHEDLDEIRLDFADVTRLDSSTIAIVELARRSARAHVALAHLDERARSLFDVLTRAVPPVAPEPPRPRRLAVIGEQLVAVGPGARALAKLIADSVRVIGAVLGGRARLPTGSVADQVATAGANALSIISLLSFFLGMSLAFQSAVQLRRFGAGVYTADFIGVSMVREFGPLLSAIIVTGHTGAAIAAELGTMRVGAELDAMTAMGVSPVRYLVVPRLVGLVIVEPILALTSMFVGIAGGLLVCNLMLRMAPAMFWLRLVERVTIGDFARGLTKSVAFAVIIGAIATHLGLRARRGAQGVGAAATRTVVASVFSIVTFDALFETLTTMVLK
jgi:phospholipid/cholesterol/gamma-HCH transport system permease protein